MWSTLLPLFGKSVAARRHAMQDSAVAYTDLSTLEGSLDYIRSAPGDVGTIELLVCRPAVDERSVLDEAVFDPAVGLVGDTWYVRPSPTSTDGGPHPDAQVTIVNARAIASIAGPITRWVLAGDQVYADFDVSVANLPPGTQLAIGTAVLEVTAKPHTGCAKFRARFGPDALRFVNSDAGHELRLRGMNTRIVRGGVVRRGDSITRLT
jgi:hypothetical protein